MNAGKIAEYVVGILVPLTMVWLVEGGQRPSRFGSWKLAESEAKEGGGAPLRSPTAKSQSKNLGQHASCRSGRKSSVRAIQRCRSTVKNRFSNDLHTVGQGV